MQDIDLNNSVEQGGSYEVLKKRLENKSTELFNKTQQLNEGRKAEFGGLNQDIIAKLNIHSNNNCIPVDMIQINGYILLGYNVILGMKNSATIEDILSLYKINKTGDSYNAEHLPIDGTFLSDPQFKKDFSSLFSYYTPKLSQLVNTKEAIYVVFQTGKQINDLKVFKWEAKKNNEYQYVGDAPSKEIASSFTNKFDKWIKTDRSNFIAGKFPHISIVDKVFVETTGGDLTIKIENNTGTGLGIYSEPVEEKLQNLEDAEVSYFDTGEVILLKIRPYKEEKTRYFIYNQLTQAVVRLDGIGTSCIELPEGHGFIFSDGFFLKNGDYKTYDVKNTYYHFQTTKSPNGEDYLYVFFDPYEKTYVLYPYNVVSKTVSNPIFCNGYSLYDNGHLYVLNSHKEPSKVHPLQLWSTPFVSDTEYANILKEKKPTFYSKIGNSDLVTCVSDVYDVISFIKKPEVSSNLFDGIIKLSTKIIDDYYWLNDSESFGIKNDLQEIINTSILVIEEFEKVKSIQKQSEVLLADVIASTTKVVTNSKLINDKEIAKYIEALSTVKKQQGTLISLKSQRYINLEKISELEATLVEAKDYVNNKLISLMQDTKSFDIFHNEIKKLNDRLITLKKVIDIEELEKEIDSILSNVNMINDEINEIEFKDSTVVSVILDSLSGVFSKINQLKAQIKNQKKSLMSKESEVEFSAQFKLLSQSVSSAINNSDTPEKTDENLARIIAVIESLESKFSQFDEYLSEIYKKREEIRDTFENHKQQLTNLRQKRILNIENAALLTLSNVSKRSEKIANVDDLNSYFATDSMILKINSFIDEIKKLGDNTKSEELFSKLKNIKDSSFRMLRDSLDIFEDNGNVMKMGKHKFGVNKNSVELTIIPKDNDLYSHLTTTSFYEKINNPELESLKPYWDYEVISESPTVYRSEFLAYCILEEAEKNQKFNYDTIKKHIKDNTLLTLVQEYSNTLYKEGYIKGVHDEDCAKIIEKVIGIYLNSGNLSYSVEARLWALNKFSITKDKIEEYKIKYKKAETFKTKLGNSNLIDALVKDHQKEESLSEIPESLKTESSKFLLSSYDKDSFDYLKAAKELWLEFSNDYKDFMPTIDDFSDIQDLNSLIKSYCDINDKKESGLLSEEAVYYYLLTQVSNTLKTSEVDFNTVVSVGSLLGQHTKIKDSTLVVFLEDFIKNCKNHRDIVMPAYSKVHELKYKLSEDERERLRVSDFKAKPLSSFVRNKLITEAYLPIIGDNLAKQIGALGEKKRTDLMGLLLLISPPGYGKTTIVEYIASKLGLVFMKINCPSIGHGVKSLDPREAPDATSRKEIEKINLSFEMGNNVMLYLDDIQHTNPELLQKFISLCDGSRRVDGVWNDKPKTYDLKGRKFCIVMAGNPYTESGEVFKIPDMLANRADIYNLGDMLSGQREVFELSYIENSLTANSVLAPLATRNLSDLYQLIRMAKGESLPINELEYPYSPAEVNEIVDVIKKMLLVQAVVLKVNQQYIASAATSDKYRIEPAFKLQGSYRNMNKLSEKIVSAMNDKELNNLVIDHYMGEAQTLTNGTEENVLKLKELLEILTPEESERWVGIKKDFIRNKVTGGDDADGFTKIAAQLSILTEQYQSSLNNNSDDGKLEILVREINDLGSSIKQMAPNLDKDEAFINLLNSVKDFFIKRTQLQQLKAKESQSLKK